MEKTEIQVFVSNPGDIINEVRIVKSVCEDMTDSFDNYCKLSFRVKEWQTIVRQFGQRPQSEINERIGRYDIYLGMWYMHFGTKTGEINSLTGEEFQSGTEEEFTLAIQKYKETKSPAIFLFFKSYEVEKSKDLAKLGKILSQLEKLDAFKKARMSEGLIYEYTDDEDFRRWVNKILLDIMLKYCNSKNVEEKERVIAEEAIDLETLRISYTRPEAYINRELIQVRQFQTVNKNPFETRKVDPILTLINTQKRIVILGDAGTGKSTEMASLAFQLSRPGSQYFPILQLLNTYTVLPDIENFLPEIWKKIPKNILVIIWDGLDEIQTGDFNKVVRQINGFAAKYPEIRMVISSRTNFYTLPINNSPGTLPSFEPYFISNFDRDDIEHYFSLRYKNKSPDIFLKNIIAGRLEDLASRPFFLMIFSELFENGTALTMTRGSLLEAYLVSRIRLDQEHYVDVADLRSKREEILLLLERVALGMEILCKNIIEEIDLLKIITGDQFILLRRCTAFGKKEGSEYTWKFEHNNIQEYLAAKALSKLSFDKIITFIAFEPAYRKLIPSWVNTLTFLFGILAKNDQLLVQLIGWLIANAKGIIVKMEKNKIPDDVRSEIFRSIYNYYKEQDIWMRSNTFSLEELAEFSQTGENLDFIIHELNNPYSSKVNQNNAVNVLGYFKYPDAGSKKRMETVLLTAIEKNISDNDFIYSAIYAMKKAELKSDHAVSELMRLVGSRDGQYIRSAVYSYLIEAPSVDLYVDYLLEGKKIMSKRRFDRGEIPLADESWNWKESILSVKTFEGLKKLIDAILLQLHFDFGSDESSSVSRIVDHSIVIYREHPQIYDSILKWYIHEISIFDNQRSERILKFFVETCTREKAFRDIWKMTVDEQKNRLVILSRLMDRASIDFIITLYNNHDITNKDMDELYNNLKWTNSHSLDIFETEIGLKTKFKIEKPVYRDFIAERKKKDAADFDILFEPDQLKKEVINIFKEEKKASIKFEELYDIRKENLYSGTATRLLRDFCNRESEITKSEITGWFKKNTEVEWYCVQRIYEMLTNNKELDPTPDQRIWIFNWCKENLINADFTRAISTRPDGRVDVRMAAIFIFYFSTRFNFKYDEETMLDMLSFDYPQGISFQGLKYVESNLSAHAIMKRVEANLKEGITDTNVLKNHVVYAVNNHLTVCFPFIRKEILNQALQEYVRIELLNLYFPPTGDLKGTKELLPQADDLIKWHIFEKLMAAQEFDFILPFLLKILHDNKRYDQQLQAMKYLVRLENPEGFKFMIEYFKSYDRVENIDRMPGLLGSLIKKESVPYLMELLLLGYQKPTSFDRFEDLQSAATGGLFNLALINQENFDLVTQSLNDFMEEYREIYPNVKYISMTLERLDNQFYMNLAQSYNIRQVVTKLENL